MKVLIYGDILFSVDMVWGFRALGHDVKLIVPSSIQELEQILSEDDPDLLMTLGTPAYYNMYMLKYIGDKERKHMKYIHWDTDGITWLGIEMNHINLSKPDMVFTVCPEMLNVLREKNIPSEMLFYAYAPCSHFPAPKDKQYDGMITYTGAAYPQIVQSFPNHYRVISMNVLFKPLLTHDYRIDFYGDNQHKNVISYLYGVDIPYDWLHGRYPYQNTYEIYTGCFINLVTQNHENTLTKRTFEILGSGGFILSYDNAAIREFFTPGKDLVVSKSPEQTLEMVEYYKNNPEAYELIRKNALISAQNHTYKQRAEYILSKLYS